MTSEDEKYENARKEIIRDFQNNKYTYEVFQSKMDVINDGERSGDKFDEVRK